QAGVELPGRAGDTLREDPRVLRDEHAHRPLPAAATAFCAPSSMSAAAMMSRPDLARISFPFSTLVPSMRTTSGTERPTSFAACTPPSATPPHPRLRTKMLLKSTC